MRDDQGSDLRGTVAADVVAHRLRHGLPGRGRAGVLVLPAVLAPQLLGTGSVALAEQAERLSVDRVALASVHRQARR